MIKIFIKDKCNNFIHEVGTSSHDVLYVDDNGIVRYYNLQTGDGNGEKGLYEFVPFNPMYDEYNPVEKKKS